MKLNLEGKECAHFAVLQWSTFTWEERKSELRKPDNALRKSPSHLFCALESTEAFIHTVSPGGKKHRCY